MWCHRRWYKSSGRGATSVQCESHPALSPFPLLVECFWVSWILCLPNHPIWNIQSDSTYMSRGLWPFIHLPPALLPASILRLGFLDFGHVGVLASLDLGVWFIQVVRTIGLYSLAYSSSVFSDIWYRYHALLDILCTDCALHCILLYICIFWLFCMHSI